MARKPRDHSNLFALRCEICGYQMVRTPSGYLACPNGHGALHLEAEADERFGAALDRPAEVGLFE